MSNKKTIFNKNFILLWQGQLVSNIGSQLGLIATSLWIKEISDSGTKMGLLFLLAALSSFIFNTIGGTFADLYNRKKIIVYSDFIKGFTLLIFVYVLFFHPSNTALAFVTLYLITTINSAIDSVFFPAIFATIPDIVEKKGVPGATSLIQSSKRISALLGQGAGGILFNIFGFKLLILLDALSFIISSITELFITVPEKINNPRFTSIKDAYKNISQQAIEGYHFTLKWKELRTLILVVSLIGFFVKPVIVLLPFYTIDVLQLSSEWLGYFLAFYALGSISGSFLSGFLKIKDSERAIVLYVLFLLIGVGFISLGMLRNPYLCAINFIINGLITGYINNSLISIIMTSIKSEIRGRVMGFVSMVTQVLAPIAFGLSGVIADYLNKEIGIIFLFCGLCLFIINVISLSNSSFRNFLKGSAA